MASLRLSCFPESVGLNDQCGPQIQLKVITGATSSQTNNRVRPRPRQSFVIFFNPDDQITIRSPSGKLELESSRKLISGGFQSAALITSGWRFWFFKKSFCDLFVIFRLNKSSIQDPRFQDRNSPNFPLPATCIRTEEGN